MRLAKYDIKAWSPLDPDRLILQSVCVMSVPWVRRCA